MSKLFKTFTAKKYAYIFLLGAISSLAFAPVFFFPILWISFSLLLLFITKSTNKKDAFFIGWFFGLGHFITGLYWICASMLVEPLKFAWLIPFTITGVPAMEALPIGVASFCTYAFIKKPKFGKIQTLLSFAGFWTLFEISRAYILSGFPWNLTGYIWGFSDRMIQIGSVIGTYGLTFLTIIIFSSPFLILDVKKESFSIKIIKSKKQIKQVLFLLTLIPIIFLFGNERLKNEKNLIDTGKKARIIQPNINQKLKWETSYRKSSIYKQIEMSLMGDISNIDYIVWPEASIPYVLNLNPNLEKIITEHLPQKTKIIAGSLRATYDKKNKEINKIWNTVYILQNQKIINFYDKQHLVPFGEYIPFRKFIPFINKITYGGNDFSIGEGEGTIELDDDFYARFVICYEIIFPDEIITSSRRPDLIINLTNDAWFGNTSGPYQHMVTSKMRSVEYGIPLIRTANTGISGFINSYGKVVDKINLNIDNYIDVNISGTIRETFYYKYKVYLLLLLCYFLGLSIKSENE